MLKKLLILLLFPLFLCSCSKNTKYEEITFTSWGSITEVGIIKKIISDFEEKNPYIKVKFMHIPQNYFQKIHLLFASSTEPDVIFINNLYLPVYAEKLEDLSDYDISSFYPVSAEVMKYENKLLAIPRDVSIFVFYQNKNLINKDISFDWTFDDFKRILEVSKGKKYYGVSFDRDVFIAEPYILNLGWENGIKFYTQMEGKYAPTPSDVGSFTLAQMFLDGKIGLYFSGRWMYPKIKENAKFPFEIVPFWGKNPADGSGWAISKNSKHKDSARKFVEFLASKDCIEYFASTGLIVPARKDVDFENNKAFIRAIEYSEPHIVDKKYGKTRDRLNRELFQ